MRLQVLLSVMNQKDHSIVKKANLQTDAIIVNQTDEFKSEKFSHNGSEIHFLSFDEKGVGLSRNNALMRSTADIAVFGDEDIRYVDGYEEVILKEFKNNPKADMVVFNVPSDNPDRPTYHISKRTRVRVHNSLRYGAVKMAIRPDRIKKKNIYFSLLFGGGAKYSSGEDSLLIYSVLKSGLKVYASPEVIGYVSQEDSTWFTGYTDKFFVDKGVLFGSLSPKLSYVLCLQYVMRKYGTFDTDKSRREVYMLIRRGIQIARS